MFQRIHLKSHRQCIQINLDYVQSDERKHAIYHSTNISNNHSLDYFDDGPIILSACMGHHFRYLNQRTHKAEFG